MTAAFDGKLDHFRLEEATIEDLHEAIKSGKTTCLQGRRALHRPGASLQWRLQHAGHQRRRPGGKRKSAPCAHRHRLCFPQRR